MSQDHFQFCHRLPYLSLFVIEGGFKYAKAETETQVHTGRSAIVSISNSPIVNVNTNIVHSGIIE